MKKLLAIVMAVLMLSGSMSAVAFAETEPVSAEVYVTIADKGTLAVVREQIAVSDQDGDGMLCIDEALYAAHETKYEGGAAAGYATATTEWGLGITKLWGDTSGNYGYYVNNVSVWNLADPVKAGDSLVVFVYADGDSYSDTYTWFEETEGTAESGKDINLTLFGAGYDAEWNPITVPVEGATITVNGETTAVKTDAEGKATIQIADAGSYVISAVSESQTLVPPVCLETVTADPLHGTGDHSKIYLYVALIVVVLAAVIALALRKKRTDEK